MAHDVFISYASSERSYADQVKAVIERHGYRCWMAPDSIPAGSSYADEIENAIKNCQVVVLMLSEKAQESIWVHREVERGLSHRKELIPFHIDESETHDGFAFFLGVTQRIEAYNNLENSYIKLLSVLDNKIKKDARFTDSRLSASCADSSAAMNPVLRPAQNASFKASNPSLSIDECFAKAARLYAKGQYREAAEWYRRAAVQGDADAQYMLGNMHRDGEGVEQNWEQAVELYYQAAAQGHVEAKRALNGKVAASAPPAQPSRPSVQAAYSIKSAAPSLRDVYANKRVGGHFVFGRYPQGVGHEATPITWRVLRRDADALLVIAEKCLSCKQYHVKRTDTNWSKCTLRSWLNFDFFNKAFNERERELILSSTVENNAGSSTEDRVFLLSAVEAEQLFASETDRLAKPTRFVLKNNAQTCCNDEGCVWWLRSRGGSDDRAAYVDVAGGVSDKGLYVSNTYCAVRPVLRLAI